MKRLYYRLALPKTSSSLIKHDRRYRRIVHRGIDSVRLEVFLVSIGHNLYKYYNKRSKSQLAA